MKPIEALFVVHRGKSKLAGDYAPGQVAYVGNGMDDNAVVRIVTPLPGDRVFKFRGITLSAFCEATVQTPPFIACSRAGNGLLALEPREPMTAARLAYIAAYINRAVRWRFNWYRQTTRDRVRGLLIPDDYPEAVRFDVRSALPPVQDAKAPSWRPQFRKFTLDDLFNLEAGDHHSLSKFGPGRTPVVSCGDRNNGISAYLDVKKPLYQNVLTIAFNGMNTLVAKYHPYQFAAKDDVALCFPKQEMRLTTKLFVQVMLNRERWRYSFYRKCFLDKLRRFELPMPVKRGALDEDGMQAAMEATSYWPFLKGRLPAKSASV